MIGSLGNSIHAKKEVELNDSCISGLKNLAIFDHFFGNRKPGTVLVEFRMFENQSPGNLDYSGQIIATSHDLTPNGV